MSTFFLIDGATGRVIRRKEISPELVRHCTAPRPSARALVRPRGHPRARAARGPPRVPHLRQPHIPPRCVYALPVG
jgi:hypothetical protein